MDLKIHPGVVFPIVSTTMLLSACMMVGPDYKDPNIPITPHWLNKSASVQEVPPPDTTWWGSFHDPNLTTLIQQGYRNNPSLQIAGVRVLQARAQLAQSVGMLYPQQQALIGNYNYNRIGGGSLQSVLPPTFDTALLGVSANWEIDFWGKYRRAIQSNDAVFLASLAAYDQALVTLTADIATAYIQLRTTQALIQVTRENIRLQTLCLAIAKSKFRAGQISLLDVEQAQAELSETQATLPTQLSQLQSQKDALAVLLGLTPDKIDGLLNKKQGIPKAPSRIAVGIPKETMARRPDVHQARLQAVAQSESIGAVKANLYPALSLTGTFAFASNNINDQSISDIFNWSNRTITAGPAVNWPLLNYGQITNAVRVQDAVFQQALLQYLNVVFQAQREVQDNITRYIETQRSEQYLTTANRAAIKATKLTLTRYKEGEANYTTVLNVEQQQLRVQTSLVKAQGDIPLALVALYRALGGGWEIRRGHDVVPAAMKQEMAARTNWGGLLAPSQHEPPKTTSDKLKQLILPSW